MLTEGTEGKLPSCARREPCRDPKKREKRQRTRQRTQRTTMGGEAQGCDWWNQDLGPSNTWIWWWVDDLIFSMGNPIRLRLGNRLQMEQTAAVGNGPYSNNHGEVQRGGRLKRAGIISISQDTVVYLESQQVKQLPSFDVGEILVFPLMFNFFPIFFNGYSTICRWFTVFRHTLRSVLSFRSSKEWVPPNHMKSTKKAQAEAAQNS